MKQSALFDDVSGTADFSPCGQYRYRLTREWGDGLTINFLLLNPSKATAEIIDPTVNRCLIRARRLGFERLIVTNLFALVSTDPAILKTHPDPVGPENDTAILQAARESTTVVAAWGEDGVIRDRAVDVRVLLAVNGIDLYALQVNKSGEPKHPLYVAMKYEPVMYRGAP